MSKPRVFISHAAHGDPAALAFNDQLKAALQTDFAVLLDRDIPYGDQWRRTLNTWIGGCDAAVLLLSKLALTRPWVAYEVTILKYRTECTVIPVFLDSVTYKDVQDSLLGPAAIDENQAIKGAAEAATIAKIVCGLALTALKETPIDRQAKFAEDALKSLPAWRAKELAEELHYDGDGWRSDPHRDLALALMSVDLADALAAMLQFRNALESKQFYNLFHIVSTSWVDECSAGALRDVLKTQNNARLFAILNAARSAMAECYVTRASKGGPLDAWNVASVAGVISGDAGEWFETKVAESLSDALGVEGDELLGALEDEEQIYRRPVFVSLQGAGLNRAVLEHLRSCFPTVAFLALAGSDEMTARVLESFGVKSLQPKLLSGFELQFCPIYEKARKKLNV